MKNNKFIFEGIRGSGKSTQIKYLANNLGDLNPLIIDRSSHIVSEFSNFRKSFTNLKNHSPSKILFYFLENVLKYEHESLEKKLTIIDRYVISNLVYTIATLKQNNSLINYQELQKNFYYPFGFDLLSDKSIIYLDCTPEIAMDRVKTRKSRKKFDLNFQSLARKIYLEELDKMHIPVYMFKTNSEDLFMTNSKIEEIIRRSL